jgi:hypothetical protein
MLRNGPKPQAAATFRFSTIFPGVPLKGSIPTRILAVLIISVATPTRARAD